MADAKNDAIPPSENDKRLETWIAAARNGNVEALGQLMEACRMYLLLIANQELPHELHAKASPSDLVQETCAEACRAFNRFGGQSRQELLAWLRRILCNNVYDVERHWNRAGKRDVQRELPLDGDSQTALGELPALDANTPSEFAASREQQERLLQAVGQLPEDYRQVIEWHHREGLTFEAIATRIQRSPEAVRKLWVRGLRKLEELLKDDYPSS